MKGSSQGFGLEGLGLRGLGFRLRVWAIRVLTDVGLKVSSYPRAPFTEIVGY